mgnify:CR=1 FL=1
MSTIIIQGKKEENQKAVNAIKAQFAVVNVKANVPMSDGCTTVIDAFSESLNKEEYSTEEIDKALLCCSSIERKCAECPYVKEPGCKDRLLADAAVSVQRRLTLASNI